MSEKIFLVATCIGFFGIPMVIAFEHYFVIVTKYRGLTVERFFRALLCTFGPGINLFAAMFIYAVIDTSETDWQLKQGERCMDIDEINFNPQEGKIISWFASFESKTTNHIKNIGKIKLKKPMFTT